MYFSPRILSRLSIGPSENPLWKKRFVDSSLTPALPDLKKLNADTRKELDDIHAKKHPEHAAFLKSRARGRPPGDHGLSFIRKRRALMWNSSVLLCPGCDPMP